MRGIRILVIIFSMVLIASCSTSGHNISYDYDASADFGVLKTYDWLSFRGRTLEDEWILKRIKQEVDAQLELKGFKTVSESPDFLIAFQAQKKRRIRETKYIGEESTYLEGKLVIIFLDGKMKAPIWQGTAESELDSSPTPEERDRNIKKIISKMLSNFPPSQRP